MKTLGCFLVGAPLVLLAACSTITVKRDMDPKARFDTFKTYAWAPEPNTQVPVSPAVAQAIRGAADHDLSVKGFKLVQGKTPDFYVVYHVTSPQNADVRDYTDWGFGSAGTGFYNGWTGRPATYRAIEQDRVGALVLDIVGTRRNQLDWRGAASSIFGATGNDAARAQQAVHTLLLEFPPYPLPAQPLPAQ